MFNARAVICDAIRLVDIVSQYSQVRHAKETEREMTHRLHTQKSEYETAIQRHLSFIDQLIDDKKALGEKCEKLVGEIKKIEARYQANTEAMAERHRVEMAKAKDLFAAAEKLRREKWVEEKTRKIKGEK